MCASLLCRLHVCLFVCLFVCFLGESIAWFGLLLGCSVGGLVIFASGWETVRGFLLFLVSVHFGWCAGVHVDVVWGGVGVGWVRWVGAC